MPGAEPLDSQKERAPKGARSIELENGLTVAVVTADQPFPETTVGLGSAGIARATRLPRYLQRLSIRHVMRLLFEARTMH